MTRTFQDLQLEAHEISKSRGWYTSEADNIAGKIALIHAELSEALEEYRDDHMDLYYAPPEAGVLRAVTPTDKPEGFGIELADTVIRIMDLAEYLQINLEHLIQVKMEFNKTRSFRHGGKRI